MSVEKPRNLDNWDPNVDVDLKGAPYSIKEITSCLL